MVNPIYFLKPLNSGWQYTRRRICSIRLIVIFNDKGFLGDWHQVRPGFFLPPLKVAGCSSRLFKSFRRMGAQHHHGNYILMQKFQPMTAQLGNVDYHAVLCKSYMIYICNIDLCSWKKIPSSWLLPVQRDARKKQNALSLACFDDDGIPWLSNNQKLQRS